MTEPAAARLNDARAIYQRACDALDLACMSIGMLTDLLADNSRWQLDDCHRLAHELEPGQTCSRPCCVQP